jgi:hypothetical protein
MTPQQIKQRKRGLRKLRRSREYLAKHYHVGGGRWTDLNARIAYAVLCEHWRSYDKIVPKG